MYAKSRKYSSNVATKFMIFFWIYRVAITPSARYAFVDDNDGEILLICYWRYAVGVTGCGSCGICSALCLVRSYGTDLSAVRPQRQVCLTGIERCLSVTGLFGCLFARLHDAVQCIFATITGSGTVDGDN